MNDNPSAATRAPVTATLYIVAWKYRRYGPHASLARIVQSPDSFSELALSKTGHFPRLYLLAALAALEALPEGSTVKLVCSDLYLTKWVFERLDGLVDGTVRVKGKKCPANADLLPLLQKARDRHASFTTELVPAANRDCEHKEASSALFRFMDKHMAESADGVPTPLKAEKAGTKPPVLAAPKITTQAVATVTKPTTVIEIDDGQGVPWQI